MKLLVFVIAVVVLLWLLRGALRVRRDSPPRRPAPPKGAQPMLACAWCGVHMPRDDMLPGRGGMFCGEAHRAAFEKAHPL